MSMVLMSCCWPRISPPETGRSRLHPALTHALFFLFFEGIGGDGVPDDPVCRGKLDGHLIAPLRERVYPGNRTADYDPGGLIRGEKHVDLNEISRRKLLM